MTHYDVILFRSSCGSSSSRDRHDDSGHVTDMSPTTSTASTGSNYWMWSPMTSSYDKYTNHDSITHQHDSSLSPKDDVTPDDVMTRCMEKVYSIIRDNFTTEAATDSLGRS